MMGGMDDLVTFLRARLGEEQSEAEGALKRQTKTRRRVGGEWVEDTVQPPEWRRSAWSPQRVLAEVVIDRELLRDYERVFDAQEQHKAAVAELDADIEHEARTGKWEGAGLPDVRQQSLRREADCLPAMLRVLEGWAKAKAAVYADHPDYREQWRP